MGDEFPTVPVHDLIVHPRDNELVVATHGRSVWVTDVSFIQEYESYKDKELHIIKPEEITFSASWSSAPSRWYNDGEPDQASFKIWSNSEQSVHVEIQDENEQAIYTNQAHLHKGLNLITWDYKLNQELALVAEEFKNKDKEQPLNKSLTPISEALRLGHGAYIPKGKYKLIVGGSESNAETELIVK